MARELRVVAPLAMVVPHRPRSVGPFLGVEQDQVVDRSFVATATRQREHVGVPVAMAVDPRVEDTTHEDFGDGLAVVLSSVALNDPDLPEVRALGEVGGDCRNAFDEPEPLLPQRHLEGKAIAVDSRHSTFDKPTTDVHHLVLRGGFSGSRQEQLALRRVGARHDDRDWPKIAHNHRLRQAM